MIVAEVIPTFAIYTDTLSLSERTAILTDRLFDYKRGEENENTKTSRTRNTDNK